MRNILKTLRSRSFGKIQWMALFILAMNTSFAGEVSQVNYLNKSFITTSSILSLQDNLFFDEELTAPSGKYVAKRRNIVRLTYNRENRTDVLTAIPWTYTIGYEIRKTGSTGTSPLIFETGTITVGFTPGTTDIYEAINEHFGAATSYIGYGDVRLRVTSITPGGMGIPPDDIRLELITITERYTDIKTNTILPFIVYNPTRSELSWSFVPGAETYDVEYTFIDDLDIHPTFSGEQDPFNYKTPIRICTNDNVYLVDQIYPKGKLYFRVRGVGRHNDFGSDFTRVEYGDWGYKENASPATPFCMYAITTSFESNKNWSYSAAFADEGKTKKSIGYTDGSGKVRQSQANMNSDNTVIVGENKFDIEARPVISMMPTPEKVVDPLTAFNYRELFTKDILTAEYDHSDFELLTKAVGDYSGAGKYYSLQNPFIATDAFSKYIDDAGGAATVPNHDAGFPFSRVTYTRDNTGRMSKSTAGAGLTFTLENGHELSNYYGSANSTELHRMFGTNVGIALHYKKNLSIDANGQKSISYLDQESRVIATCLAGEQPGNLIRLASNIADTLTVSLDDNNFVDVDNSESHIFTNIMNINPGTIHTFNYDMAGVIYGTTINLAGVSVLNNNSGVTEVCKPPQAIPLCADCKYKLEISVRDPDGLIVPITDPDPLATINPVTILKRTFSDPASAPDCNVLNQYSADGVSFNLTFSKIGNYTISKTLKLDTTGIYIKIQAAMATAGLNAAYQDALINCYIYATDFSECDYNCRQHCKSKVLEENPTWNEVDNIVEINAAIATCMAVDCNGAIIDEVNVIAGTECNEMLLQMIIDVSPGGFEFIQNGSGSSPTADPDFWTGVGRVDDLINNYTLPALPTEPSTADLTAASQIILLDNAGLAIRPQPSSADLTNSAYWTNSTANPTQWAQQLVKAHRDYCHYQDCIDNQQSVAYNVQMAMTPDWDVANTLGYLDPLGMGDATGSQPALPGSVTYLTTIDPAGIDPMFDVPTGSLYNQMATALLNDFPFSGSSTTDIWNFVNTASNPLYSGSTSAIAYDAAHKWLVFRGLYLNKKNEIHNAWLLPAPNVKGCPFFPGSLVAPPPTTLTGSDDEITVAWDMINDCGDKCNLNVIFWMDQLAFYFDSANCDGNLSTTFANTLTTIQKNQIRFNLMQYCQSKCGATNPMGYIVGTDVPTDTYLLDVQTILSTLPFGTTPPVPVSCNAAAMLGYIDAGNTPYTITCPPYNYTCIPCNTIVNATIPTTCFKDLINFINTSVLPVSTLGCYTLTSSCMGGNNLSISGSGFQVNPSCTPSGTCASNVFRFYRADGTAINTTNMNNIVLPVHVISSPIFPAPVGSVFRNLQCIVNSDLPVGLGTEGPVLAYLYEEGATGGCAGYPFTTVEEINPYCIAEIPNNTHVIVVDYDSLHEACVQQLLAIDTLSGINAFHALLHSFTEQYLTAHYSKCFSSNLSEHLNYRYENNEYHYTLYYYDQAGNLTQTVPPKGVHLVPFNITTFPEGVYNGITEPIHTYPTRYTYNSLNQVVSQQTPDGGLTHYYYDDKARLRFSQNAKQLIAKKYSYTIYDNQSRITQVGESNQDYIATPFINGVNDLTFPNINRSQVTITTYDAPLTTAAVPTGIFANQQQYLRTRVSATQLFEADYTGSVSELSASTHYSYDEHGNVNELVQDNTLLASLGNDIQYKYMKYTYELISGNVKEVAYQPGKADQFYHRYVYDDDNRLTIAQTSDNGIMYEKDAKYFYYPHGPQARTEIGEDKVQGTDYAYTINGWLKGINATTLKTSRDMGKDGNLNGTAMDATNNNNLIGIDALGYTLGYFDGDYTSIGTSSWQAATVGTPLSDGSSAYRNLYNANIARTTSSFMDNSENKVITMGKSFVYDQLNRLKSVNAFTNTTGGDNVFVNNTFASATDGGYKELFSYDPNGNITTADRWGASTKMDEFVYKYQDIATGYSDNTNKLRFVADDNLLTSNYPDDINDQSLTYGTGNENYDYDAIGNLTADKAEEIANIKWNLYGKVATIVRTAGSSKNDLAFKYDASGNRIAKITREHTGGTTEENWTYTYYTHDAQGNVMSVYERKVTITSGTVSDKIKLKEHDIYGSNRLGIETKDVNLGGILFADGGYNTNGTFIRPTGGITILAGDVIDLVHLKRLVGDKNYELVNHLGNNMVTVSDKKIGVNVSGSSTDAEYYLADVISSQDYFSFGAIMPGRSFNSTDYRFGGAGGQEKTDEISGSGNHYTAQFWEYDPRTGRRWNVDPLSYPWQSGYSAFNNNPIIFVDPLGLFGTRKEAREYKKEHKSEGRIRKGDDGVFSIDNSKAGTSIFKDAEFGVQTAVLIEAKRTDSKTLTPWQLGTEWLSGKGARSRDFTEGDNITNLYKQHEHVDQTRQMAINQLAQSNGTNVQSGNNPYSLGGVEGVGKYLQDYSTLATAGQTGNLIYTYLGSHSLQYTITSVDVEKRIATVTFMAQNMSTIQSATRPPVLGYTEFWKNNIGPVIDAKFSNGPMSETEQTIQWTEKIKY